MLDPSDYSLIPSKPLKHTVYDGLCHNIQKYKSEKGLCKVRGLYYVYYGFVSIQN